MTHFINHLRTFSLAGFVLLLASCDRKEEASGTSAEEEGELPTNRIAIPATVRSNLGITFAKVERRKIAGTVRAPGSFELQPLARLEYRMMLSGHVEFLVGQFDEVKKGTPIYRFRSLELLALQQRVDLAEASLRQAEAKYDVARGRKNALADANFKRAELDARVAELEAEIDQREVELGAASSALQSATQISSDEAQAKRGKPGDWVEVRAKEDGIVESLAVTNGTFVEETTLILTTIDPAKVRFHAMALQSDLPKFKNGQEVGIVPPQSAGVDLNDSVPATLQIGLAADPQYRTVALYATPGELASWVAREYPPFWRLPKNQRVASFWRFRVRRW